MRFQELKQRFLGIGKGPSAEGSEELRMDGGTSCYRPNRRRTRDDSRETGYTEQRIQSVHTGFTGMNPPEDGSYYAEVAYGTEAANGYDATGYGMTGQTDYSRNAAPADNISYMRGNNANSSAANGNTPVQEENRVERIMVLTSLKSCYEAIGFMKNNETLILTLDAIANDSEITRCEDMLAGAAFTLGCTVRMLPGTGHMILVVPKGVTVLPEENRRTHAAPAAPVSPGTGYYAPTEQTAYQPRRERRSSQNTQNWKSFENGSRSNTGYYGQEPVPMDSYTTYGGYGY